MNRKRFYSFLQVSSHTSCKFHQIVKFVISMQSRDTSIISYDPYRGKTLVVINFQFLFISFFTTSSSQISHEIKKQLGVSRVGGSRSLEGMGLMWVRLPLDLWTIAHKSFCFLFLCYIYLGKKIDIFVHLFLKVPIQWPK